MSARHTAAARAHLGLCVLLTGLTGCGAEAPNNPKLLPLPALPMPDGSSPEQGAIVRGDGSTGPDSWQDAPSPLRPLSLTPGHDASFCLGGRPDTTANGTPVYAYRCRNIASQRWGLQSGHLVLYGNKCLETPLPGGDSTAPYLTDCDPLAPGQKWIYYQRGLRLSRTDMCLTWSDSVAEGDTHRLALQPCAQTDPKALWTLGDAAGINLVPPDRHGLCIGVRGNAVVAGAFLELQHCARRQVGQQIVLDDNRLKFGNLCMDMADPRGDNGKPLKLTVCDGRSAQAWYLNDGNIRSVVMDVCVDLPSSPGVATPPGALLQVYTCASNLFQQWVVSGPPP